MTFQESDYPSLKRVEMTTFYRYRNPALVVEILKEIWETHKMIPVYPGIISMCLPAMVKGKKRRELKKGERVLLKVGSQEILGTIKTLNRKEILIENPVVVKRPGCVKVKRKEIKKVLVLEKNVLEKIWPTLVFKREE